MTVVYMVLPLVIGTFLAYETARGEFLGAGATSLLAVEFGWLGLGRHGGWGRHHHFMPISHPAVVADVTLCIAFTAVAGVLVGVGIVNAVRDG